MTPRWLVFGLLLAVLPAALGTPTYAAHPVFGWDFDIERVYADGTTVVVEFVRDPAAGVVTRRRAGPPPWPFPPAWGTESGSGVGLCPTHFSKPALCWLLRLRQSLWGWPRHLASPLTAKEGPGSLVPR
jgi:hypothetical protein